MLDIIDPLHYTLQEIAVVWRKHLFLILFCVAYKKGVGFYDRLPLP